MGQRTSNWRSSSTPARGERELRAPASCESDAESERRRTIQRALEAELTRRLNTEPPPDACDPFLALVSFNLLPDTTPEQQRDLLPDEGAYERPWRMAVAAVGAQRVTAFRRSVRGHASAPPPGDPLTDRAALATLLVARGVPEIQATSLADEAEVVLDLVSPPPGAPAPRSRLGGPALLPPGVAWPEGRTFLAALDLHELRANMLGGRDGSDLVLLQLQSDHALGFVTYENRALELRLSRACAQAGDWSAVRAVDVHNL